MEEVVPPQQEPSPMARKKVRRNKDEVQTRVSAPLIFLGTVLIAGLLYTVWPEPEQVPSYDPTSELA